MKKTFILLLIGLLVFSAATLDSFAAKSSKKGGAISQDKMNSMNEIIDRLTKKIYANSLFSPQDNAEMIDVKIQLDNQMLIAPDITLAPLYYKAANLYKIRERRKEAIDCYQTILENFPDTALAPKSRQALQEMGVDVVETPSADATDGSTTGQAADVLIECLADSYDEANASLEFNL